MAVPATLPIREATSSKIIAFPGMTFLPEHDESVTVSARSCRADTLTAISANVGSSALAVYAHIEANANDGRCRLSYADLADLCRISRRQVVRLVLALEGKGFLSVSRSSVENRHDPATNEFILGQSCDIPNAQPGDRPSDTDVTPLVTDLVTSPQKRPLSKDSLNVIGDESESEAKKEKKSVRGKGGVGGNHDKRGTRLPPDFTVTAEMKRWAVAEESMSNKEIDHETVKFKDHFGAVSGKDGIKLDWVMTWRNWMRRRKQFAPRGSGFTHPAIQRRDANGQPIVVID